MQAKTENCTQCDFHLGPQGPALIIILFFALLLLPNETNPWFVTSHFILSHHHASFESESKKLYNCMIILPNYANSDFDCAHFVCCSSATISLENENENFSPPKLVKYMIVSSTF